MGRRIDTTPSAQTSAMSALSCMHLLIFRRIDIYSRNVSPCACVDIRGIIRTLPHVRPCSYMLVVVSQAEMKPAVGL